MATLETFTVCPLQCFPVVAACLVVTAVGALSLPSIDAVGSDVPCLVLAFCPTTLHALAHLQYNKLQISLYCSKITLLPSLHSVSLREGVVIDETPNQGQDPVLTCNFSSSFPIVVSS